MAERKEELEKAATSAQLKSVATQDLGASEERRAAEQQEAEVRGEVERAEAILSDNVDRCLAAVGLPRAQNGPTRLLDIEPDMRRCAEQLLVLRGKNLEKAFKAAQAKRDRKEAAKRFHLLQYSSSVLYPQ